MSSRLRLASVLVVLLAALGCAGLGRPKPEWSTAPDVDFASLSTYAWVDRRGETQTVLTSQIRSALAAELQDKGYEHSPDAPDFLIEHEVVEHDRGRSSSPVRIGIGIGTWGRHVGGSVGTSVPVGGGDPGQSYRLMIRAIEPDPRRELWVGGTTSFELPADAQVIDRAVSGAMRGFPGTRE